jgi:hypothetical protein
MKHVQSFETFSSPAVQEASETKKAGALSEKMCEAINKCCEMMAQEAKAWHQDENTEHTAEGYATECNEYMKERMENLAEVCSEMMANQ